MKRIYVELDDLELAVEGNERGGLCRRRLHGNRAELGPVEGWMGMNCGRCTEAGRHQDGSNHSGNA